MSKTRPPSRSRVELAGPADVAAAPAIANAVFHATGRRVRDFPIIAEAMR